MTNQPIKINKNTAIWLGLCGLLGSLILFVGDMLFYYNGDSTDHILNMGLASSERIIASGVCALLAAWLYTLGAGQIYYAFQPAKSWQRMTAFFSFAAVMITYGVVHAAYVAIATSAKIALEFNLSPDELTQLASDANNALRYIAYLPFCIFTLVFSALVLMGRTYYPKWILIFSPIVPFLFGNLVVENLEGEVKMIIGGGYLNLILTLFFSASSIALWKGKHH